jgi:hypothetical protein
MVVQANSELVQVKVFWVVMHVVLQHNINILKDLAASIFRVKCTEMGKKGHIYIYIYIYMHAWSARGWQSPLDKRKW